MLSYELVVIGASAGGMDALKKIISQLDEEFNLPVIVVQHVAPHSDNYLVTYLDSFTSLHVVEASEKQRVTPGFVYFAPPNYHLLLEENKTFTLTVENKVNFSRPSIDVLFETAAIACREKLIGVLLTGASNDGADGIRFIHSAQGLTIVQDPETAYVPIMPKAAIDTSPVDHILPLEEIAPFLNTISRASLKKNSG